MADYFFDSSGLTKRYAQEIGSAWVENITDLASGNTIFIAEITQVEVTAATARKMRGGFLNHAAGNLAFAKLQHDITDEYILIEIDSEILQDAVNLVKKHFLRGYDAILNNAAQTEGLIIENPNNHP